MKKNSIKYMLFAVFMGILLILPALAEEEQQDLKGKFIVGYRSVSTSGAEYKYREDFNLEDGVRLFNLSLHYAPKNGMKKFLDRLDLTVNNFGGDPFETFSLNIQKFGLYKFTYDRKKASYFYHDLFMADGHMFDPFMYNFDRVMDSAFFRLWLTPKAAIYVDFDRFSKKGERTTSFDINRIEFEMDKPIHEDFKEGAVGLDLRFKRFTLVLEEKITDYETSNSLFLPGYADGGAGARYPSSLNLFVLNQPYDFKTNTHSLKFTVRPFDRLILAGAARYSTMDMNLRYEETARGVNYIGRSFEYGYSGTGSFDRKIQLYDFDLTYLIFDSLAVVGSVRYNKFSQTGDLSVGAETEYADFGYDTLGIEGGLQFQPSAKLGLTAGYRYELRELENLETVTFEDQTKSKGFFGKLSWNASRAFSMTADYQRGTYDDPYTLISASSYDRFKTTIKMRAQEFVFNGSYQYSKTENDVLSKIWDSRSHRLNLRAGFHNKIWKVFAGYSLMDVEHAAERMIYYPPAWSGGPGSFLWDILYEGRSNLFDANISANLNSDWKIGFYGNLYSNKGSWELSRTFLKAYAEYTFGNGLVSSLGYRYVDYEEKSGGYNNYSANIFEIAFGYRWK